MRKNPFFIKCFSIILLLAFSQRAGAGLMLHNALHGNKEITHNNQKEHTHPSLTYTCSCTDDFQVPFGITEEYLQEERSSSFVAYNIEPERVSPIIIPVYHSLRGPPLNCFAFIFSAS